MTLDPTNYSPDVVAMNLELFGKHPALKADPVVKCGHPVSRQSRDIHAQTGDKRSRLEILMQDVIDTALTQFPHLDKPVDEYRFAAIATGGTGKGVRSRLNAAGLKDWRFDKAWPNYALAIEVEGGTHSQGRHVRGQGYEDDCEKYNFAAIDGWTLLRFTSGMIKDGRALDTVLNALRFIDASL